MSRDAGAVRDRAELRGYAVLAIPKLDAEAEAANTMVALGR